MNISGLGLNDKQGLGNVSSMAENVNFYTLKVGLNLSFIEHSSYDLL